MSILWKLTLILFAVVGALSYSVGVAAQDCQTICREQFEVSVNLPTSAFHVLPADPQVLIHQQALKWDTRLKGLLPFVALFDVKNSAGAIAAYLEIADGRSAPWMNSSNDSFELAVQFNGKLLSTSKIEVVDASAARDGGRFELKITPIPPAEGYVPGRYYGNVRVMFEAL